MPRESGSTTTYLLILWVSTGCPDDGTTSATLTTGTSSDTLPTSSSISLPTTTDGTTDDTTSSGGDTVPCPEQIPNGDFGSVEADVETVDITISCPGPEFFDLQALFSSDFTFDIRLYRPDMDGWPPDPVPLIVFSHGNGQITNGYSTLFPELNRIGFAVASVDEIDNSDSAEDRAQQILCASRFLANDWDEASRLNGTLIFMGHSQGGEGAVRAANLRLALSSPQDQHDLVAVMAIAPARILEIGLQPNIPLYTIQGAIDQQTSHSSITLFDRSYDELVTDGVSGRYVTWLHGVTHDGSGGFDGTCNPDDFICSIPNRGNVALREYFSRFLRWRVFGQAEFRANFAGPDNVAIPPLVADESLWDEFDGKPQVYRGYLEDTNLESGQRIILDAMEDGVIEQSTANGAVIPLGMFDIVEEGPANTLIPRVDHRTGALHVRWSNFDTTLVWTVPELIRESLVGASFFSFRVANVADYDDPTCTITSSPVSFTVFMRDINFNQHQITLPDVPGDMFVSDLPEQDRSESPCLVSNFMRHVRLPLDVFCQNGIDIESLTEIEFRFDISSTGNLLIDSLEFTRSPFDDPGACGPPLICM